MSKKVEEALNVYYLNNEYNIAKFMKNHPGGTNTLYNASNKDIAEKMELFGHSNLAYRLLEDYKVSEKKKNGMTKDELLAPHKERLAEIEALQRIEDLVDWSKPMLSQLNKLGNEYKTWVQYPVDKKLRMFSNPILESMTFTPWYIVPIFWTPIIVYLLWHSYNETVNCTDKCMQTQITTSSYIFFLAYGVFLWTFLEYTIHRWVFHSDPGESLFSKQLHFLVHGLHHKVPFDDLRQVFPPLPALFLTSVFYVPIKLFFPMPIVLLTGGLCGYLIYDMIHFYVHHGSPENGSFLYIMKRYHANHHFVNPDKGFGISSKLWDAIFGTKIKLKKLTFSLSWK